MMCRTTVLAGTFALILGARGLFAQATSHPRIARIPAPVQSATPSAANTQAYLRQQVYAPATQRIGYAASRQPANTQTYIRRQAYTPATARIGYIVPPPAVVPQQNSFPSAGFANGAPQVAAFYYLPTVVLTDGRVFANFNGIYEQVLRQCPVTSGLLPTGFATPACWIVDSYGRYQVVQSR
jgi:hypothetical protein